MSTNKLDKKIRKAFRRMLQLQTKQAMLRHYNLVNQATK